MAGPGEAWKSRREAMGKSIEDVAIDLRVSAKFIRGIEEGNFKNFPVRVFSTGFIRAYAKYLSEDPEPILSQYFGQLESTAEGEVKPAVRPEWLEREKQRGSRRTAYISAAAVVLVIGIVLAWISLRPVPAPPPPPDKGPEAQRPDNVALASLPVAPDNASSAGTSAVPAPAPTMDGTENAAVPPRGDSTGDTGPWHVQIEATEQTWLLYQRDDGTPIDVILNPGDRIAIRAEKKLRVRIGNAGGVAATVNGKPLPPFGPRGKIREFRLGE